MILIIEENVESIWRYKCDDGMMKNNIIMINSKFYIHRADKITGFLIFLHYQNNNDRGR